VNFYSEGMRKVSWRSRE